jgi:hypothetical protein
MDDHALGQFPHDLQPRRRARRSACLATSDGSKLGSFWWHPLPSKFLRRPPSLGVSIALVAVQRRQLAQLLQVTPRQVDRRQDTSRVQLGLSYHQQMLFVGVCATGSSCGGEERPWRNALRLDVNCPAAVLGPVLYRRKSTFGGPKPLEPIRKDAIESRST